MLRSAVFRSSGSSPRPKSLKEAQLRLAHRETLSGVCVRDSCWKIRVSYFLSGVSRSRFPGQYGRRSGTFGNFRAPSCDRSTGASVEASAPPPPRQRTLNSVNQRRVSGLPGGRSCCCCCCGGCCGCCGCCPGMPCRAPASSAASL